MSQAENKQVILTFLDEVWNKGRAEAIDELYAPHGMARGMGKEFEQGPEQFKAFHGLVTSTCSHIKVTPQLVMAEGDHVLYHSVFDMIHVATDTPIRMAAGGYALVKDGKIVKAENVVNFLDLLTALEAVKPDVLVTALQSNAAPADEEKKA